MHSTGTDVFVIGGGPAGLAASIAARRRGLNVILADNAIPPVDKACGEGMMPDAVAAARELGLDLSSAGHEFLGIRFCEGYDSVQAPFPSGAGRGVRRTELHSLMTDAARSAGVRMMWGSRVSAISSEGVVVDGVPVRSRWIVGADGHHSAVRRMAGLNAHHRESRRYGYRRHFRVANPGDYMELHWAGDSQLYLTPVGAHEICVVLISRDHRLRLEEALPRFPAAAERLAAAEALGLQRGGVTVSRKLCAVTRGNVALVGDASGSVDAVTGEGLCLLFQQASALAACLAAGDPRAYDAAHGRILRRARLMSGLMLMLGNRSRLRARAIRAMASEPSLFARLLATHVGVHPVRNLLAGGVSLGWQMLTL